MIELKNISKTFHTTSGKVEAVKDANIVIKDGEIFGFIGYSGAGKSTIVRCINLLERPTTGNVIFDDVDLTGLSDSDLRKKRKEIGMIFQQFNLLKSLTVFENVAFNLKNESLSKSEIRNRVEELLDLVGIPEKADSYPSQLSGGQKQRVAIARALANNPKVLLCDEATSALDPQTTSQILQLIKELNQKLKITVIIITHEMAVIKSICDRVAVMENGNIVEVNSVYNLFSNPHTNISKGFVNSNSNKKNIINLIKKDRALFGIKEYNEVLDLDFLGANTKESIISSISKKYNIDCNIIFGDIDLIKNQMIGKLIVSLDGGKDSIENAKKYLLENGIKWEVIS